MKIRQGFVSNSSTSSFVVLAVEFPKGTITKKHLSQMLGVEEDDYDALYNADFFFSSMYEGAGMGKKEFFGISVATCDETGLEGGVFDLEEAQQKLFAFLEKLPSIPAEHRKVKIISGQYAS